jgi:hypothetical protein
MNSRTKWFTVLALLAVPLLARTQPPPQAVLQRGYDANVSGANLSEATLNASNISPGTFGLLFKLPVDANVYAQPLYAPNVVIPGLGAHNVLYVATMNDSIYAFDADVGGAPLWSVNLASFLSTSPVLWANYNFAPISTPGNLGILSTPVIDPAANVMYVVACTLENSTMAYRLHAIDITNGSEPYGPGVLISGNYGGATFDPRYLTQRVSLVLAGNQVVVGFGAMQSEGGQTYSGWVMAYDKTTLQQSGIFAAVPAQIGGGIWQSGRPPAVDGAGYVYVFVGNAHGINGYDGVNNFSESALKLDPSRGLALVDWFTPGNWSYLDEHDKDLSSSGPLLIPGTTLLAGGGKVGTLYLLNTNNLGKFVANNSQIVQKENITAGGEITSGPVYWSRSAANGGPLMYNWGIGDVLKTFPFGGGLFATSPSAIGSSSGVDPGAVLSLSANADQHGSGLVWATTKIPNSKTGVLHAYDAENVANELWNSAMNSTRDGYGNFANYVPPLIANSKVYVSAFFPGNVAVYGLLPYTVSPTSLAFGTLQTNTVSVPQLVTATNISSAAIPITSITITGASTKAFSQTNTCAGSVAVGSICTVRVVFKPTSTGSNVATLNVNGGGGTGTQLVTLSGTAIAPNYSVSPTSLAFGSVQMSTTSSPQLATVTNSASAVLPITNITITGTNASQFSQTNTCGTSVSAGSSCTISAVFAPTSTGSKSATLSVNGGSGAGALSVTLSGTSIAASFTLSSASVAFGSVPANTVSAPKLVTVTNGGSAAMTITGVTLAGTNAGSFSQTNTCTASIPVASTCTISVVFMPSSAGTQTATLKVSAPGATRAATLTGTGT